MGDVKEVRGPGVIGKQPVLEPGESFEYTSGCALTTPFGSMRGTYQMVTATTRALRHRNPAVHAHRAVHDSSLIWQITARIPAYFLAYFLST